jgi:tRNA nucleotidyltransferase (CCA-adding enzyme)
MTVKVFQVGGAVRDKLLGLKSKDIDFAVEASSFEAMHKHVQSTCKQIFLIKPEFLTIRALHPKLGAVDFVMCRKDGAYSDGRRPNTVEPGTIFDDLARRDFTVNAMAIDEAGNLIDPHNGQQDLEDRLLRCVGLASDRFNEDALRILRAMRFSITKDLKLSAGIQAVLREPEIWVPKLESVSTERKREELHKCFAHSTPETLLFFKIIDRAWADCLFKDLWLKPTSENP